MSQLEKVLERIEQDIADLDESTARYGPGLRVAASRLKMAIVRQGMASKGSRCTCALCVEAERYRQNIAALPEYERDFMEGIYDNLVNASEELEMMRYHYEGGRDEFEGYR